MRMTRFKIDGCSIEWHKVVLGYEWIMIIKEGWKSKCGFDGLYNK